MLFRITCSVEGFSLQYINMQLELLVHLHTNSSFTGREDNFETELITDTQGIPYDYKSFMHYFFLAFTENGWPTITSLRPDIDRLYSRRVRPTEYDFLHINLTYCDGMYVFVCLSACVRVFGCCSFYCYSRLYNATLLLERKLQLKRRVEINELR